MHSAYQVAEVIMVRIVRRIPLTDCLRDWSKCKLAIGIYYNRSFLLFSGMKIRAPVFSNLTELMIELTFTTV